MEQTFTILILSVGLFLSLIYIGVLFNKNSKLKSEIDGMKNTVNEKVKQLERQIKAQEQKEFELIKQEIAALAIEVPKWDMLDDADCKLPY